MYCKKCGTKLKRGNQYCPQCGALIVPMAGKRKNRLLVSTVCVIVLLFLAVVFIFRGCSGMRKGGYNAPIESLIHGMEEQDGNEILSAFPDETIDTLAEESGVFGREQLSRLVISNFLNIFDLNDKAYNVNYNVKSARSMVKGEISNLNNDLIQNNITGIKIQKGEVVNIILTIQTDTAKKEINLELVLIKSKGEWYISPTSL